MENRIKKTIFVASPTDVQDERDAIDVAVSSLNLKQNYFHFEIKKWEKAHPASGGNPISLIKDQLGDFSEPDLFILIMWHKFGTPTKDGRTGSVAEFEEALSAREKSGSSNRPEIMVYRCTADVPYAENNPEEFSKITEFFNRPEIKENSLYYSYHVREDFLDIVENHIISYFENQKNKVSENSEKNDETFVEVKFDSKFKELEKAILEARQTISEVVTETPLHLSHALSKEYDCEIYLKLENLQETGSFKIRGALNAVNEYAKSGVTHFVAVSAGNHGLGVALAASRHNVTSTIFMPKATPLSKIKAVEEYTKHVELVGNNFDDCKSEAEKFCRENDCQFIHPFDDPKVVAGQGTIGLELIDQFKNQPPPDYILIPFGGGGLFSGIATAVKQKWPDTKLIAVEPARIPSFSQSIGTGVTETTNFQQTIADGVAVAKIGEFTSHIAKQVFDEIWTARDENIAKSVSLLIEKSKIIAEGAAACTLGALLSKYASNPEVIDGKKILLIISGGNVDSMRVATLLKRGLFLQRKLSHFRFEVVDKPGTLADITGAFKKNNVNVIDLQHHPLSELLRVGMTYVDTIVETRGLDHSADLIKKLQDQGFNVRNIDQ